MIFRIAPFFGTRGIVATRLLAGSTAVADEFAKNEGIRKILRENGDDGRSYRWIEHNAYFETEADEARYRTLVLSRGYRVDREDGDAPYPRPWHIVFSMLQAPDDIDDETNRLQADAARLDGEYDGWETDVLRR